MKDEKEKDVQTDVETEETVETDETLEMAETEETVEMAETDDAVSEEAPEEEEAIPDVIMSAATEEPKKKGRVRGFFKTRKLAIGITVLAVLLVANIAVFGANKMGHKGFRDHGGGKVVEREYAQGQTHDRGDRIDRDKDVKCASDKADRADKADKADRADKADKADKGDKPDKAAPEAGMAENGDAEADMEATAENGAAA